MFLSVQPDTLKGFLFYRSGKISVKYYINWLAQKSLQFGSDLDFTWVVKFFCGDEQIYVSAFFGFVKPTAKQIYAGT